MSIFSPLLEFIHKYTNNNIIESIIYLNILIKNKKRNFYHDYIIYK